LCFDSFLPEDDIKPLARPIRYAEDYMPGGVNVNFIAKEGKGISMRTYERGVEDETLSCGTGVTAAALGAHLKFALASPIQVTTRGGILKVYFENKSEGFANIWLEGPADMVFEGIYTL
jgi:diaminopimelate epimerase